MRGRLRFLADFLLPVADRLRALRDLVKLLLDLDPLQKSQRPLDALPEVLFGKAELLQGLLQQVGIHLLHGLLQPAHRLGKLGGVHLLQRPLQFLVFLQRLRRKELVLLELIRQAVNGSGNLFHRPLQLLVLLHQLLSFLLLLPVEVLLVLLQILAKLFQRPAGLLRFPDCTVEALHRRFMLFLDIGQNFFHRRVPEEITLTQRHLRTRNSVVVENFGIILHHVIRHKVQAPECPAVRNECFGRSPCGEGNVHPPGLLVGSPVARLLQPVEKGKPGNPEIIADFDHQWDLHVLGDVEVRPGDDNGHRRSRIRLYPDGILNRVGVRDSLAVAQNEVVREVVPEGKFARRVRPLKREGNPLAVAHGNGSGCNRLIGLERPAAGPAGPCTRGAGGGHGGPSPPAGPPPSAGTPVS